MKKVNTLFKNQWFWFGIILLTGAILRLWQIGSWQHLTYDQSRDYIIIKRIIVDHKYTLVGPTVSIAPGFFLPPFYYYTLAPFLWIFKFHIIGPDVYTALFGIFSIVAFYFLAKDFFGIFPALISSFALAVNPYLIQTSRHSWNPNTLCFYLIIFALSWKKYVFDRRRKYLLLAGFSLGWAIGLHLTVVVFLPMFLYLFFLEIKNKQLNLKTLGGIFLFLIVFLPLGFFDLRHKFPITRAGISYLQGQKQDTSGGFVNRTKEMITDCFKMPAVLLSGLFQKENLTVRPSNITAFSAIKLNRGLNFADKIKSYLSLLLWLVALLAVLVTKERRARLLLVFISSGLLVRLCFPANLFYFYYYLVVFPFVYLILAFLVEKTKESSFFKILTPLVIIFLAVFSLLPKGIYAQPKPESYFLPTCEIISLDFSKTNKIALAGNVADRSRWEHNALEYHYFLEALYKIPMVGWEAADYKQANVLYFIDEGEVKEPLKFGGMEVEAFAPKKIEKVWKVKTGQTIYKMTRE